MISGTRALRRQDPNLAGPPQQLAVGKSFFAILNHVGAAGKSLADHPGQLAERRQPADQHHQPGIAQPTVGGDGGHRQFFERVDVVPEHLETARQPDVDQLRVFLQRSQRLADSFEVGRQHRAGIFADLLGRRHDVGADVFASVAGAEQQVSIEPALGLGQPVANFLESLGEPGIIEHEPNVILGDPQPLPRPIGRGVENPPQVDASARLAQIQRCDSLDECQRRSIRRPWLPSSARASCAAQGPPP